MRLRAPVAAFALVAGALLAGAGPLVAPLAGQATDPGLLLARADSAFEAHDTAAALVAYRATLEADPGQSRAVYQMGRLQPPGSPEQIASFRRYTELEPDDAWGFSALGRAHRDAGDLASARAAYRAALDLAPDAPDIRAEADALDAPATPTGRVSFEPVTVFSGDSDATVASRVGGRVTWRSGDTELGGEAVRLVVGDGVTRVTGWAAELSAALRPVPELRLRARAGLLSAADESAGTGDASILEPVLGGRVRWRPQRGPAAELRARREPVTATPRLLASPVVLSEARLTVDVPVYARLYARALGRVGRLAAPEQTNTRTQVGVGPVVRLAPGLELNGLIGRSGYARPTTAGYFAPDRVDLVDAGFYWEREKDALLLALDAGAGLERIQPFDAPRGDWGRAFRLWSLLSWSFGPGAALRLEAEAYDTRAGEALVATGEGWRWGSVAASLAIRP